MSEGKSNNQIILSHADSVRIGELLLDRKSAEETLDRTLWIHQATIKEILESERNIWE